MAPKVSIIIPTYNVEKYLAECMDSVIHQTLQDIEIICINDGSTDHSLDMLQKYAAQDPRIIVIDKKNEGYGIGMNLGIDKASGEYIGIVEPDDFVPPEMYETLYNAAHENDLDFVKADFYRFTGSAEPGYEKTLFRLSEKPEDYNKIFDPGRDPSTLKFIMNTWSGIYKRSFLNKHQIRHNTTPGASFQDTGFWMQTFIHAHRAMLLDTPLYMNRRDNPNSSVYDPNKVYTMNKEFEFIREILARDPEIWDRFKAMYWRAKFLAYIPRLDRIAPQYKKDYVRKMYEEFRQGMDAEEIDPDVFSAGDRNLLQKLLDGPSTFLLSWQITGFKMKVRNTLAKLKNSGRTN